MTEEPDTPSRIIAAAERLFIEGGEDATSLRAITREAGVNVAAVHYHFGSRDALLRAVLDRKIGPLNARRLELLDEAVARHGARVPVEAQLAAFLLPDLELLAALRGNEVRFARFMGRTYTQPSPAVAGFLEQQFNTVGARLYPLLERALPHLDPAELRVRMGLVVAMVTALFAAATPPGEPHPLGSDDIQEQLRRLLAFVTPGLSAPGTVPSAGENRTADHNRRRS